MRDFLYQDHHGVIHNAALLDRIWVVAACGQKFYLPSGGYSESPTTCPGCLKTRPVQNVDPAQSARLARKHTHF